MHASHPFNWAKGKQHDPLSAWMAGGKHPEVWEFVRTFGSKLFPGTPPEAFMGFCANGSLRGNTTEGTAPVNLKQQFHEMGCFGTEGGLRKGSAPNPDPLASMNTWGRLHDSPEVRALLGRDASMENNAWKTAIDDQVAVGLVNLRKNGESANRQIPESIRATPDSLWYVALCFMGWSAGVHETLLHIAPHHRRLSEVDEDRRWGTLMTAVEASHPHGHHHLNAAYSCIRTAQKLEAGRMLSEKTEDKCLAWFDPKVEDLTGLYEKLTQQGYKE